MKAAPEASSAGNLNLMNPTAAATRKFLRSRGWLVNVTVPLVTGGYQRLDYCPEHARPMAGKDDR